MRTLLKAFREKDGVTFREALKSMKPRYVNVQLEFRDHTVISNEHSVHQKEMEKAMLDLFGDCVVTNVYRNNGVAMLFEVPTRVDAMLVKAFWEKTLEIEKD